MTRRTIGLCECGCGQPTSVARMTSRRRGYIAGQHVRFRPGHNMVGRMRGPENLKWAGGTTELKGGYKGVYNTDHPRSRKNHVAEHILVAEAALGKPLPPRAAIHHVNGQRTDNRPGNLVVCQNHAYHMLLHQRIRALLACGHASWRKCNYCKQYDEPSRIVVCGKSCHHRACANRYQRERSRRLA